ncbi:MAG: hypothetical protein H0T48_10740 [Gemmatimonadaceae bacterium]|nr:hypothetical protein [Gemmatimonadaceae bacterium]
MSSPRLTAPDSPSFVPGVATAKTIEVCVDASSPAGTYTIDLSGTSGVVAGDIVVDPAVITLPGQNCVVVFFRPGADQTTVTTTLTITTPAAGTFTYTCVDDVAVGDPLCVSGTTGGNTATVQANAFHGTTTTFLFTPAPPPPPPPPPAGCTFTQGYYKNKGNALIAGNTNFDGSGLSETQILNTPSNGNGYIILAKQYIAAKANIAGGAGITGDALIAYNAATAYFATGLTIANPYNATYTKDVLTALAAALDLYNNGVAGQGNPLHCDV